MTRLFKVISVLLACCAIVTNVFAQDVSTTFNDANRLYEQQKFSEAAAAYEKIVASGKVSVPLYFNLGNAWFKAGATGRAIAAYRTAQKLAPRDPDVRANLQFARDTVQNSKPPLRGIVTQFIGKLTLNEWTVLAASFFTIAFLLLALGELRRDKARPLRFYALLAGLVSLLLIGCTAASAQKEFTKHAVIVADEAVLRRGPFDESQSAFALRDGTELTVLDQRENWVQVADTANRVGWIRENQIARIP